jgi:hypothetical protein
VLAAIQLLAASFFSPCEPLAADKKKTSCRLGHYRYDEVQMAGCGTSKKTFFLAKQTKKTCRRK